MDRNDQLIARVKYLIEMSRLSQGAFARRIGIDPSNLSKYLTGKIPLSDSIVNRLVVETGVSRRWLRDGSDVPFSQQHEPPAIEFDDREIVPVGDGPAFPMAGNPVYDIDVTAGREELSRMFTVDRVVGMINLPGLQPDCSVVHVSGDSMSPVINDGGYVAIRPIRDMRHIFWGQIYVVVLDEYRLVKFVHRNADRSMVTLHSANPAYDDMEVERDDIRSMFYVEMVLNCDLRG